MSIKCTACHATVTAEEPHRCPGHPYRPVALVVLPRPALVEAATCQWCRWREVMACRHPVQGHGTSDVWCSSANPNGECPHFSPSWWTRVGRALRLWRAPAMVDPRVWERGP